MRFCTFFIGWFFLIRNVYFFQNKSKTRLCLFLEDKKWSYSFKIVVEMTHLIAMVKLWPEGCPFLSQLLRRSETHLQSTLRKCAGNWSLHYSLISGSTFPSPWFYFLPSVQLYISIFEFSISYLFQKKEENDFMTQFYCITTQSLFLHKPYNSTMRVFFLKRKSKFFTLVLTHFQKYKILKHI